jgi:hypothetical protein
MYFLRLQGRTVSRKSKGKHILDIIIENCADVLMAKANAVLVQFEVLTPVAIKEFYILEYNRIVR